MNRSFTSERRAASNYADKSTGKTSGDEWDRIFNAELERRISLTKAAAQKSRSGESKSRKLKGAAWVTDPGYKQKSPDFMHPHFQI